MAFSAPAVVEPCRDDGVVRQAAGFGTDKPGFFVANRVDHQRHAVWRIEKRPLCGPVGLTEERAEIRMAVIPTDGYRVTSHPLSCASPYLGFHRQRSATTAKSSARDEIFDRNERTSDLGKRRRRKARATDEQPAQLGSIAQEMAPDSLAALRTEQHDR